MPDNLAEGVGMGLNVIKLTAASADALMDYQGVRDRWLTYALDADPRDPIAADFVAWEAANVVGVGAAQLGLGLDLEVASGVTSDRDVTAGHYRRLMAGQDPNTGEVLVTSRASPVYEMQEQGRDSQGRLIGRPRFKLDDEGNKIRKMVTARDDDGRVILNADGTPKLIGAKKANLPTPIELVYAAPKSYSVALAALDEAARAELIAAFQDAVRASITTIEATAPLIRVPLKDHEREMVGAGRAGRRGGEQTKPAPKTQGSATRRTTGGLIALMTTQFTARPTAATEARGAVADVHLHCHTDLAPFALSPETSAPDAPDYKMIDSWALMQRDYASLHAAQFEMDLASRAESLGYVVTYGDFNATGNGLSEWRLEGISKAAEKHFSTNASRLAVLVEELRAEDAAGRTPGRSVVEGRMHDTKLAKTPAARAQDRDPDYALWRDDAGRHGVDLLDGPLRGDATSLRSSTKSRSMDERLELWRERMLGTRGMSDAGLHRADATFPLVTARATAYRCAMGLFDPEEMAHVEHQLDELLVACNGPSPTDGYTTLAELRRGYEELSHDERVEAQERLGTLSFTTMHQIAAEKRIAARLHDKLMRSYPAASASTVDTAVASQARPLDDEQRQLVDAAVSGRGVVTVEGHAGTGKTTAVRAVLDALRADGAVDQVIVVSTAARTAEGVGARLKADVSGAVERITTMVERGSLRPTHSTVVVIDEVAMVDTARMDALLGAVGDARIIQLGDDHQLAPIGPGGWLQDFTAVARDTAPDSVVSLERVYRQVDPADRDAYRLLREGKGLAALQDLDRRGRVAIFDTAQEAQSALVAHYRASLDTGLDLNQVRIGTNQSNRDLDYYNLAVQNNRLDRGEVGTDGFRVTATNADRSWMLRAGDPVVFLEGYGRGANRVANGVGGVVREVDPLRGTTVIDLAGEGRTVVVRLTAEAPTQPVGLAYAMHGAKFQGGEAHTFLVRPAAPEANDVNAIYSLVTRSTHETHLFLDRETHGEDAINNMARYLDTPLIKRSAQSYLVSPDRTAPAQSQDPTSSRKMADRVTADHRVARLARVIGDERAQDVRDAPAFPALMKQMDEMAARGIDPDVTLRNEIRREGLDNARDPAAVLTHRLKTTNRAVRLEDTGLPPSDLPRSALADMRQPTAADSGRRDRSAEAESRARLRAVREARGETSRGDRTPSPGIDRGLEL